MLPVSAFPLGQNSCLNEHPVEAQWHGDLDAYGSFCITVPLAQTSAIIAKLEISNCEWKRRAASDSQAQRNLNVRSIFVLYAHGTLSPSQIKEDPFVVKKCVLLVLRPDLFLPEERPLPINTHRVLRVPGGPPLADYDGASWTLYYSQRDGPYLVDSSNQEFNEFEYQSKRHPDERLSVFSLLVNTNSKLQAAKRRSDYPLAAEHYIELVERAVNSYFLSPAGFRSNPGLQSHLRLPLHQDSPMSLLRACPLNPVDMRIIPRDKILAISAPRMMVSSRRDALTWTSSLKTMVMTLRKTTRKMTSQI